MAEIKLSITKESKSIPDELATELQDLSFDNGGNGIELYPKDDDFPMPWDATCYIEGDFFIIDGDLGQQGSHKGWAKTGIPLDRVARYLDLTIHVNEDNSNEGYVSRIEDILKEYNWI